MQVDGRTVRLEPLTESHIASVITLEKRINTAPWSEKAFRNELQNPQGIFRVALLEGRVIGYGGIWAVIDEAHITTVSVAEEHRRKGLGRFIVSELLLEARNNGMACSTLEVRAGNTPAIKLYEMMGFKSVGVRKAYYPDNKEDALVMWLYDLEDWSPPKS